MSSREVHLGQYQGGHGKQGSHRGMAGWGRSLRGDSTTCGRLSSKAGWSAAHPCAFMAPQAFESEISCYTPKRGTGCGVDRLGFKPASALL
jgi:hypothetical protein